MQKIKDPILLGFAAGLTGYLLKAMGKKLLRAKNKNKTSYARLVAGKILTRKNVKTPRDKLMGVLADAAMATGLGVGCVYFFKTFGDADLFRKRDEELPQEVSQEASQDMSNFTHKSLVDNRGSS